MLAVLLISSLLNIAYLMPIVIRGFFYPPLGKSDPEVSVGHEHSMITRANIKEAPLLCVAPPLFTAFGCIVLFFFIDPIYQLLLPILMP